MKFTGKLGVSDLEGGYPTISDGKQTYKLEGGGVEKLSPGDSVEVEGKIEGTLMGVGFGMPTLKVKSIKVLK